MKTIHLLPEVIIAKIAAGEVIERPGYAVKELIDNAIDAKADFIKIEISQGGLKRIIVMDNGVGMSEDDLVDCFKLHTTSKVGKNETSLFGIKSLGFRGEALSSIAAISDVVIQSRTKSSPGGTQIELKAGDVESLKPVGMPKGTILTINNLFYTVPARKKFLKSIASETRFISEIVSNFALAFPNVHFVLINNNKIVFDFPKTNNILDRIQKILGNTTTKQLIPFEFEDAYVKASGFLSKPQLAMTVQKQYLFVNGRRIQDRMISLSVKEAYGNIIGSSTFPPFIIFLNVPSETIDINIHPRKEQVNFLNAKIIFELVRNVITEILKKNNLIYDSNLLKSHISPKSNIGKDLKESTDYLQLFNPELLDLSNIQQIHNLYLISPTKKGLLIIDQHAAHERILYEQFKAKFQDKQLKKAQILLNPPRIIDLDFSDLETLKENINTFSQLGFGIEEFSDNTVKITHLPKVFIDHNIEKIIVEMLSDIRLEISKDIDTQTDILLKYLSCRTAVKSGDKLTKDQSISLIKKLEETVNSISCPHGRPTKIEISISEINKYFKR